MDFRETEWYRETKARITPGDVIRIYRENRGWSRAKFRKLAQVLDINVHRILDPTRIE